jgi:hypothetical protein
MLFAQPRRRSVTKKPTKPIEEIRAELLADPAVHGIASKLGVPLPAYVEKVLEYVRDPDKEPMIRALPDAEAKAAGEPSIADIKKWLQDEIAKRTGPRHARERDVFEGVKAESPSTETKK